MAFTRTPMESTDQTKDIPLLQQWQSRDAAGLKDVESINVVWDVVNDPVEPYHVAIKREGLSPFPVSLPPSELYGSFFWKTSTAPLLVFIGAFGTWVINAQTGAFVGNDPSVVFSNNIIGRTVFKFEDGTEKLIITDGANLVSMDETGIMVTITDPDRPVTHRPYPVYLDGYLFLADDKGNIANSDYNNPASWSTSNFINAEAYPDKLLALARHGVYIVAFGEDSIQFFYDAANPTGTPLAVYGASSPQIGFRGGLAEYGDTLIFTAVANNGQINVYSLEGFKANIIGTSTVSRRLDTYLSTGTFIRSGHLLEINGHSLYTWADFSTSSPQPLDSVWAVDLETKLWTKLEAFGLTSFPIRTSVLVENNSQFYTFVSFSGTVQPFRFLPIVYRDNGIDFRMQFTTKNYDFGTRRMKFGARLIVSADQTPTSSNCTISWSDDDYQTFSTPRPVDLSGTYTQLYALGKFRKRAFRVNYTGNFPMRFTKLELDYSQGQA